MISFGNFETNSDPKQLFVFFLIDTETGDLLQFAITCHCNYVLYIFWCCKIYLTIQSAFFF